MRTRKRLTKKELKRDRFVDATFDWALWARENGRTVAMIGAGVVVVILALVLYRTSQAREAREASQRFQDVVQTYSAGNYQLAANDFKQFVSQYGGSPYGDEAKLYLANSYLLAGDPKSAIRSLEESRGELEGSPQAYAAASLLGAAYETAGDLPKAADAYSKARDKAKHDYQRAQALMNLARVYEAEKAADKAAGAYREVIQKYPETTLGKEANVRLAELTIEPLAGAPEPSGVDTTTAVMPATSGADSTKPGAPAAADSTEEASTTVGADSTKTVAPKPAAAPRPASVPATGESSPGP